MDTVEAGETEEKATTPGRGKRIGGWAGLGVATAAIIALAASGLVSKQLPGEARAQVFGPTGFGRLVADMTTEEAMATGELKKEPLYTSRGCADHAYSAGTTPDPAAIEGYARAEAAYAESKRVDKEKQQAWEDARKIADEASAKINTIPDPQDPAREALVEAWRTAAKASSAAGTASLEASRASSKASDELTKASQARIKATNDAGIVSINHDGPRLITPPAGIRTPEGIGRGSTVKELQQAFGSLKQDKDSYQLKVAGHPNWILYFHVSKDVVYAFGLRNVNSNCLD